MALNGWRRYGYRASNVIYSISSAENFASGSIKILNSLNMQTIFHLVVKCGDINTLNKFATILVKEPSEYVTMLNHEPFKRFIFS